MNWIEIGPSVESALNRMRGMAKRPVRQWWYAAWHLQRRMARESRRRAWSSIMNGPGQIGSIYGVRWLVLPKRKWRVRKHAAPSKLPR